MLWVSASLATGFASAPPVYFTVWNIQRGNQQWLAEPAGTAQEIIIGSTVCHTVNIFRLTYIKVVPLYDFLKSLYPYRASLQLLLFHDSSFFWLYYKGTKLFPITLAGKLILSLNVVFNFGHSLAIWDSGSAQQDIEYTGLFDRLPYLHYIYRGPWADFPAQHLYFSKRHFKRTSSTLPFSASANDPFKLLKRSGNWRLPFLF